MSQIKIVFEFAEVNYIAVPWSFASGAPSSLHVSLPVWSGGSGEYVGDGGKEYYASLLPFGSGNVGPGPDGTISGEGTFTGDVTVTFGSFVERG